MTSSPSPRSQRGQLICIDAGARVRRGDPVMVALHAEWRTLGEEPVPQHWQTACPDLAGAAGLRDLLDAIATDRIAAHLVMACQRGDRLAGRVLVQALTVRLAGLAARDAHHEFGDYVSTLWELIHDFPIERRRHAVSTNLVLDTRKRLSRSLGREVVVEHPPEPPPAAARSLAQAAEIIDLASRSGVVCPASVAVLRSVYLDGLSGREAARRHGISEALVRYRCSSAVKRIRHHLQKLNAEAA